MRPACGLLALLLWALPRPAEAAVAVAFQGIADNASTLSPELRARLTARLQTALSSRADLTFVAPTLAADGPRFVADEALTVVVQPEGARLMMAAALVGPEGSERARAQATFDRPGPNAEPAALDPMIDDLAEQLLGVAAFGRVWPARPTVAVAVAGPLPPTPPQTVAVAVPPPPAPPKAAGDRYLLDLGYDVEQRNFYGLLSASVWDMRARGVYAPAVVSLGEGRLDTFRGGVALMGVDGRVDEFTGGVQAGLFENGAERFVGLAQVAPWNHASDFTGLLQAGIYNEAWVSSSSAPTRVRSLARVGVYHHAESDVFALVDVAPVHTYDDANFHGALRVGALHLSDRGDFVGLAQLGVISYLEGNFEGALDAGLFNIDTGHCSGVAQVGIANFTGGSFVRALLSDDYASRGGPNDFDGVLQLAAVNMVDGDFNGVFQVGLTGNIVEGSANAFGQIAYFYNWVDDDFSGVFQLGVANIVDELHAFLQVGGGNIVLERAYGAQLGFANLTIGEHNGLQAGFANAVRELYGAQLGFFNFAAVESDGVQLGVINMAERLRGLQVGLVNISSDGGLPWTVLVNAGFL